MLDPRIYRAAFVPVALAVIVLAFSLGAQKGPLGTTLAPDAFNVQNVGSTLSSLAARFPHRRPGSPGDQALAGYVAGQLTGRGYGVSIDSFSGRTVNGSRILQNVVATRTGFTNRRIAVVAHRDSTASPGTAELSGTATLLELARVLAERTLNRTIVFASVSGSAGSAGVQRLASQLGGPLDAVIVLGDMAGVGGRRSGPVVVPWSGRGALATPVLRNTVASALAEDAGVRAGASSLPGQIARLAFPLTLSEQGPFAAAGDPAVFISLAGERGPASGAAISTQRLGAMGRAMLRTITALEQGPDLPAPSAYLIYDRKLIPAWGVRLLVLMLLLPPAAVAIDGLARARRRGHRIGAWLVWVLAGAAPFALAAALAAALGVTGAMPAAPPGPVGDGAVALGARGIALMLLIGAVLAITVYRLRSMVAHAAGVRGDPAEGGGAVALLLVMCACTAAIWVANPFAAALAIPAIHLWIWAIAPDLRLRLPVSLALIAVGLAPAVLEAVYYARAFGLGPIGLAWTATLMLAGGKLGIAWTIAWSVMAGCATAAIAIAVRMARRERREDVPVTVRGPVTYAGPGSLGGTESALRARR